MKSIKVGLLGLGTVGQGVATICARNRSEITRRAGRDIDIKSVLVRDLDKARGLNLGTFTLTTEGRDIIDDPEIDVVVEMMGGEEPALSLILAAIANGKSVVTANKALIAERGNQIFSAAEKQGVEVAFEPAVAGGIPVIKAVREGLAANRIEWIAGIINGTGNFILTEMTDKGSEFSAVLEQAQALGYAEADPTFDVEGIDAAHKLTILASIAFGIPLQFDAVYTEGISKITREDVVFASELGYRIKHLGIARKTDAGIELRVHPTLIPSKRLIANVDGVMNAIVVHGDAVGSTLYYGPGAGSEATGSAVVADLVDVVRTLTADPEHRVPHLAFQSDSLSDHTILPSSEFHSSYYLRLLAVDQPGVLADVTRVMAELNISIEAILQKEPVDGSTEVPIIMLTPDVREGLINQAIEQIEALPTIRNKVTRIRVESLD